MEKLKKVFLFCLFISPSFLYSFQISDSTYYPLIVGSKWEYEADFSPHSETITDTLIKNGNRYFGISRYSTAPDYWLREENNKIYYLEKPDSAEFLLFDFTINIGDSIEYPHGVECSFGRKTFLVGKNETIVTPSDTFYNCYHFEHRVFCSDAGITDIWFAKGVGKVMFKEIFLAGAFDFTLKDYSIITSSETDEINNISSSYVLFQNYPNPFNASTVIEYSISNSSNVSIILYNLMGEKINVLENNFRTPGNYKINFDAGELTSGIYYYQIKTADFLQTKKLVLLK